MNKKNLILFMPSIEIGGVEKNFIIISNFLSKKFNKITIITTSFDKKYKFSNNINFVSYKSLKVSKFSRRLKFLLGLFLLFLEIIKNKNNLVLCFQANIYCAYMCKILGTKIIIRSNSAPDGWSKNFFKKIIYKHALRTADKIIVNSLEFKKSLKKRFNLNSYCIYNPLDKADIIKKSKKSVKIPFFKKKTFNFINVARFADQKDHQTLLNGFLKLKDKIDYRLLLIGSGRNEVIIRNFIKLNNLEKKIFIKKNIQNPFPYIKKSDAFVLSSKFEGLPNVILEAIVLNKFIISSDCPTGPTEILDNGKGGLLFKTDNFNDLSQKISFYIKNKKKCNNKIKFAKKRINRFDYQINLNKYLNIINET
jgi:glycosyltransferase involved in cell wall biosynthesis